jgi:Amt family ammonium transporter
MFFNGILAGLVGITAGANLMSPTSAIIIGMIAGILVVVSITTLDKLKLDDPVGAISVHLVCGVWGTLAVGLLGSKAGIGQFFDQLIGIGVIAVFCLSSSFLIFFTIKKTIGLRVSPKEEIQGLDNHEHGAMAYPDFAENKH